VAPSSTASLSGTVDGSVYASAVTVTISSSDPSPGSGVSATYYQIDGGAVQTYGGAFMVTATGNHTLAYYSRDVAGNYSTTKSVNFWIKSPTVTVVTSSVNPSVFHQSVSFKATVTPAFGATPLGSVAFKNNGVVVATVALSGGVATFTTNALTVGSHTIIGVYGTSGKDIASVSAAVTQTVNKAATTTTVTSSVNPSSWHQAVTFTATVHGAFGGVPSGTVTFKNGAAVLGTGVLNGSGAATFTSTALSVAVHSITITYPGDTDFLAGTSSPLAQTVNKAATTTTLVSSLNPSNHGTAVTFTATITPAFGGAVTGTVNFKDGSTIIGTGTVNAARKATFTTSTLTVGTHPITAVYPASTNLKSSFSTAVHQVVK
jgi:Bacterial Ig-like domain (group 3)